MARALRIEYEGAFYHVTSRGNERKNVFFTRRDYEKFKEYVAEAKKKFHFILHCYVLMSNHYHMLIETPEKNLHRVVHYINSSYSTYLNTKRKRSGHLFQGRYKAIVIDRDSYLMELSGYIHLNPVRAKMVEKAEHYSHTSYHSYISAADESIVSTACILGMFSSERDNAKTQYRAFVEKLQEAEVRNPLESVYGGTILGDEDFVNDVLAKMEDDCVLVDEHVANRKALRASTSADLILAHVSDRVGKPVDEVLQDRVLRKISVYLLKRYSDATNREISNLLGRGSQSTAAKVYERFVKEVELDERLKRQLQDLERGLCH